MEIQARKEEYLALKEFTVAGVTIPATQFEMSRIKEAEARLNEIAVVRPETYSELDYTLQCCYRDSKNAILKIMERCIHLNKIQRRLKSQYTLEHKQQCLDEGLPKSTIFSTKLIEAFLETKEDLCKVNEELERMEILSQWFDNKAKVMDKATTMMKQKIRLYERAGNYNLPVGG